MTELCDLTCKACKGGVPPLKGEQIQPLLAQLTGWSVVADRHLSKDFAFPDFKRALAFVNRVGELAERQRHHPVILFTWGKAIIEIWTHKVDGLTESDFILAAKIDKLPLE